MPIAIDLDRQKVVYASLEFGFEIEFDMPTVLQAFDASEEMPGLSQLQGTLRMPQATARQAHSRRKHPGKPRGRRR